MIAAKMKEAFLDRRVVIDAVSKAKLKVLGHSGGYVRAIIQRLIKPAPRATPFHSNSMDIFENANRQNEAMMRDQVSPPGHPPYGHGDNKLKQFTWYAYDAATGNVIVGYAKLNDPVGVDVPFNLEHGGDTTIVRYVGGKRRERRVHIAARPAVGPGMEKALPRMPQLWENSVVPV